MADTFDRLRTALLDRYTIEEGSGVGRLTTAQAAARQSVGVPTLAALVASANSQLAEPRVYSWNNAADYRRRVQMNADNTR